MIPEDRWAPTAAKMGMSKAVAGTVILFFHCCVEEDIVSRKDGSATFFQALL